MADTCSRSTQLHARDEDNPLRTWYVASLLLRPHDDPPQTRKANRGMYHCGRVCVLAFSSNQYLMLHSQQKIDEYVGSYLYGVYIKLSWILCGNRGVLFG